MIIEIKSYDEWIDMDKDFFIKNNKITTKNLAYISNIIEDDTKEILFKIIEHDCIRYLNFKKQYHNSNGPALVSYDKNGNVNREEFYIENKFHNLNGPAYVSYYKNGDKKNQIFCIEGKKLTEEEFNKIKNEKEIK